MVPRICLVVSTLMLVTCATAAHSQSVGGQTKLRARLPFSGLDQPT